MITGQTFIERGWPQGPIIGIALDIAKDLMTAGASIKEVLEMLENVRQSPDAYADDEHVFHPLAMAIKSSQIRQIEEVREHPLDAPIWGKHIIDQAAIDQLQNAMRLPVTVGGALMPDAHVGYGIPIGGVVALDNAVAPYMVGVDIACRVMMTVYPATDFIDNSAKREQLKRFMRDETRFGVGATFDRYSRREHDVLDDEDWNATKLLMHLKEKGAAQLGTSGSGNHFVDAGLLKIDERGGKILGAESGTYLAIMTHSGSRGVGANIADHYSKLAQKLTKLPDKLRHLAWLPLDTEAGQEYWVSMNLAGKFASACHHTIHRAIARRLGMKPVVQVENHHNFCIAGDQMVDTPDGAVRMDEIRPGDMIHAFNERGQIIPTTVTRAWRSGLKEIYEVRMSERRLRCSADHPILTLALDDSLTAGKAERSTRFEWRLAGDLKQGDLVVCVEQNIPERNPALKRHVQLVSAVDIMIRPRDFRISRARLQIDAERRKSPTGELEAVRCESTGAFARSVLSVTATGVIEDVFDLTIEQESHAFICEGIVVHNCWEENWQGRKVYVHRKGATPAHRDVLGIIPGSQGHNSYIVRGLGSDASINSASHGAGRLMSRTQAKQTIPKKDRDAWLRERGVELMAGGIDESPQVYKDINQVLALQTDLVEPIATFNPKIVLMSDDGKSED